MNDKAAAEMVRERKSVADKAREEYLQKAVDAEKLYHNWIDETSHPYLSNIALPWPYIIIESYLGKCIQMLAAILPYVRIVEEDDDSRPKAKKVEKDVNMVFYKQKWPIFAYNLYKKAFKHPAAFVYEKPWGMVGGEEMPVFEIMNFFKTWVNPYVLNLEDDDAFLIYETYHPLKFFKRFENNPNYKNIAKIRPHDGDIFEPEEREVRAFKSMPEPTRDKYSNLVKTEYYFSHDDIIVKTNDTNTIRNDGDNFIGRIPVRVIKPIPLDDEFYGMSILEQGKGLFAECNENRNQYNDAVNLMLNPQWVISRDTTDMKKTSIVAKPGNIIWTDDVDGAKPWPVDWNILAASINRNGLISTDIQTYSNAFPQMRGQPGGTQGTATGDLILRSAGELRSDTYNILLSMMSIEDMAADIVEFKKMMMTQPSSFNYWPEGQRGEITTVTPEDYYGKFTYKAFAGYKQTQEIERKQLIEALTLVTTNQMFAPLIAQKANEWLERLLDSFPSIRSPEQLYVSDEEMAEQQMQQFIQMLITGGMPGMEGSGEKPALGEKAMRMPEQTPNPMMTPMISNQMMR